MPGMGFTGKSPAGTAVAFGTLIGVLLVLLFLSVPRADAARGVTTDQRGDAIRGFDIVRVVTLNGAKKLAVKVVYRGKLKPGYTPGLGVSANIDLDMGAPADSVYDNDFAVGASFGVPGRRNIFYFMKGYRMARCPGLGGHIAVRRGIIRIVVPQRCFGRQSGRVRVAGYTYANKGVGPSADYMESWGPWIAKG